MKITDLLGEATEYDKKLELDVTQDVTQDDVYTLILEMIKRNNKISAKQLAEKLGISIRTVRRKIKEMDNIEYIGHGYSGYWKIKK